MPIVYLLRHAQSTANTKGILAGRDNSVELTKKGFKQAKILFQSSNNLKLQRSIAARLQDAFKLLIPICKKEQMRLLM
jgi:broad specificity phosphatase PhoE